MSASLRSLARFSSPSTTSPFRRAPLRTFQSLAASRQFLLQFTRPRPSALQSLHQKRWDTSSSNSGGVGGAHEYSSVLLLHVRLLTISSFLQDVQPPTSHQNEEEKESKYDFKHTAFKCFEAAATTFASILILGLAGYGYHRYYKALVLSKIENAFNPGDPQLDMVQAGREPTTDKQIPFDYWLDNNAALNGLTTDRPGRIERDEQHKLDAIIAGETHGKYYLLIGEKGTGKTSMLLSAMQKVDGHNCAMLEAHPDPEIFRIRLGKALDYEYHEDYIGSLFSIRGPRDTTAILDIERALNKLEKVALTRKKEEGKPLILMINSMHLIREDAAGLDLLHLLQQRAEAWAASGICTVIFNSDDYWVFERLKQNLSRMEVVSVKDLPKRLAFETIRKYRKRFYNEVPDDSMLGEIYHRIGGRLAFLYRVAKSPDMMLKVHQICEGEKTWLLSQCGLLGMEMDDDVMNQQKLASAAMVLVRALVEQEKERPKALCANPNTDIGPEYDHSLPELPLYRARQVMTRADFIQQYDHLNLFTIDTDARVRADSVPMMHAFRDVVNEPGFDEYLEATLTRIADIESLGRTRELSIKDLWYGGKYNFTVRDRKGRVEKVVSFASAMGDREEYEKEQEDGEDKE
ncbi:hypothetical protein BJ508DRAFT_325821 [Ascobolus immersus RN42]|uniref:Orc1-like AAA ATPase domain-containing protein n=1 Tax=Ascobolus immersus RN42 TaxID=1160509 RepID=A0A3N4ID10_ASCIM|nr:hypothetical protein BJ508DRAFT_325821 [Ascobolus immersus RN42]